MSRPESDADPLVELAEEFAGRRRRGEHPSLTEYIDRYPEQAERIRRLFPAMVAMEELGSIGGPEGRAREWPGRVPRQLGDYKILREIGRGGMGVVYEAEQVSLGRHVALKVLPDHAAGDAGRLLRFRREARAAARLHHTNIVPVFEVGREGKDSYYAMQFIQGLGLDQVIEELRRLREAPPAGGPVPPLRPASAAEPRIPASGRDAGPVARSLLTGHFGLSTAAGPAATAPETMAGGTTLAGAGAGGVVPGPDEADVPGPGEARPASAVLPGGSPISEAESGRGSPLYRGVARIGQQVAAALAFAHARGIVHRDIKPANLLLDHAGVAWVADFGLAKAEDDGLTGTGDLLGTLRYMAPERFRGQGDGRADVYALGLTLYELLTLRPAFEAGDRLRLIERIKTAEPTPPRSIDPRIPRDLETVVLKAIEKDPGRRYPSAEALAEDLRRFLADEPIRARAVGTLERGWRLCRRNPAIAGLSLATAALLIATAATSTVGYVRTRAALTGEASARDEAVRGRDGATRNLYHSLVREARALRLARRPGYRARAWEAIAQALKLETPDRDVAALRSEAVACMGDFVGQEPVDWASPPGTVRALAVAPGGILAAVISGDGSATLRDVTTGRERARLREPGHAITSLAFGPDGTWLVTSGAGEDVKLWSSTAGGGWEVARALSAPPRDPADGPVAGSVVAVAPGGRHVAVRAIGAGRIVLYDRDDQGRTRVLEVPGDVRWDGLAFSPDGLRLVANSYEGRAHGLRVWHVASGKFERDVEGDFRILTGALAFSPDGRWLACGSMGMVTVLDASDFRRHLFVQGPVAMGLAFSPDSRRLAFTSVQQGVVRLWDIASNQEVAELDVAPADRVGQGIAGHVGFGAGGTTLIAARDGVVRAWGLATRERRDLVGHARGGVTGLAFHPGGILLASAGNDLTVRLWDVVTCKQVRPPLDGFRGLTAHDVAFSPDGGLLAASDWDATVRFYEVGSWELLKTLDGLRETLGANGKIWSIAFDGRGRRFAAAGDDGLGLWMVERPAAVGPDGHRLGLRPLAVPVEARWPNPRLNSGRTVRLSPDGGLLAWSDIRDDIIRVHLWDLEHDAALPSPPAPARLSDHDAAFLPGGRSLVYVAVDGRVVVWDADAGRVAFPLGEGPSAGEGGRMAMGGHVALSDDGRLLAASSARTVTVWDMERRAPLFTLPEQGGAIWSLAWSPDRKLLAVGSSHGDPTLWDLSALRSELATVGLEW